MLFKFNSFIILDCLKCFSAECQLKVTTIQGSDEITMSLLCLAWTSQEIFVLLLLIFYSYGILQSSASEIILSELVPFYGGLGSLYMTVAFRFANVGDFLPMKAL